MDEIDQLLRTINNVVGRVPDELRAIAGLTVLEDWQQLERYTEPLDARIHDGPEVTRQTGIAPEHASAFEEPRYDPDSVRVWVNYQTGEDAYFVRLEGPVGALRATAAHPGFGTWTSLSLL